MSSLEIVALSICVLNSCFEKYGLGAVIINGLFLSFVVIKSDLTFIF